MKSVRVVLMRPGGMPEPADIDPSLESLQGIVGGYLEAAPLNRDGLSVICNEDGIRLGLPLSAVLPMTGRMVGAFIVTAVDGSGDMRSLTPDEQATALAIVTAAAIA